MLGQGMGLGRATGELVRTAYPEPPSVLTRQETQIARLVAEGLSNADTRWPARGVFWGRTGGSTEPEYAGPDQTAAMASKVREFDVIVIGSGPVNHRALLTHQGKDQARIAAQVILDQAAGESVDEATPWSAHLASADRSAVPHVHLARGGGANLYADGYRGRARMVVDEDTRCLLG
ncbi:helix-turn-helix domain-containing protein [Kribbella jiaozuonensis]|uniref:hypothetical protein n=1 Tax=Kribbella jiaozuonensis TaxID=2575441 RepID=UPI00192DBB7D|nr:hypothetical protein [Kribbella jiaozuonensis]